MEECGDYEAAERAGRAAVEIHPGDVWATHAVTHVMEMQGRHKDGISWLEGLKGHWDEINNFGIHLWWHRSLYHLELERYDEVLELYDNELRKEQTDCYSDLQNAVALLWRLHLRGIDLGDRWVELADKCEQRGEDDAFPYNESHYVLALIAAGRGEPARKLIAHRKAHSITAATTHAPLLREVYLPVCEAFMDYHEGNFAQAAEALANIKDEIVRGGGSDAQRDVFTQTMISAAMKGERYDLAGEWLAERTTKKPFSADAWRQYAMLLDATGDAAGAGTARGKMEAVLAGEGLAAS